MSGISQVVNCEVQNFSLGTLSKSIPVMSACLLSPEWQATRGHILFANLPLCLLPQRLPRTLFFT